MAATRSRPGIRLWVIVRAGMPRGGHGYYLGEFASHGPEYVYEIENARKYARREEAEADAMAIVAQFPDLIGQVWVEGSVFGSTWKPKA
jgi:hypothetical protein